MSRHSQKGSALLIVLGFLSFMVVSAVAFAIWMRTERLPSSALRRSVASRYLVKAALAQPMSRVDDAIRSHPYPGVWNTNDQNSVYRDRIQNGWAFDWWEGRVFMPPNPSGMNDERGYEVSTSQDPYLRYAPITKTVSVLTLEALGYLPPSIVNDVRMLSRSSWAAQWEYFNFDAGRYAFCAVNVSDMLDINKIAADRPRTSAAAARRYLKGVGNKVDKREMPPPSRFSLAYLFRRSEDQVASPSGHTAFDNLTHTGLPDWPDAPLVSLMDYNLAMGNSTAGSLFSPFYWLLSGRTKNNGFYGGSRGSQVVNGAARQPFVTDSWFPRSNYELSLNLKDLAGCQPFQPGVLIPGRRGTFMEASDLGKVNVEFLETMLRDGYALSNYDLITLWDYLDDDNVPISLSAPCAERVPMVTTLGLTGKLGMKFEESAQPDETLDVSETERRKIYNIRMNMDALPTLVTEAVFPFMSGSGDDSRQYDVQAFTRLVFVDEEKNTDPEKTAFALRSDGYADFRPRVNDDWKDVASAKQFRFPEAESDPNGLLITAYRSGPWKPEKVDEPKNVYENGKGAFRVMVPLSKPDPVAIMKRIEVYEIKKNPATGEVTETRKPGGDLFQIVLRPFNANGTSLANLSTEPMPESDFDQLCGDHNIRPYLMAWVRVRDRDSDVTVDMVPAMFDDDTNLNGVNNASVRTIAPQAAKAYGNATDQGRPVLNFPSRTIFSYANAKTKTDIGDNGWLYKSCYTVDPRYNWAPENWWFEVDEPKGLEEGWYNQVFKEGGILDDLAADEFGALADNPRGDRARDPLLFVSNLGYLQSVGEMAFLPRLSLMDKGKGSAQGSQGILAVAGTEENAYNGTPRSIEDFKKKSNRMPCARAAWKCYQSFRTNPNAFEFGANFYRRGLVNPRQGFYVNPFTQSKEVMLAALANTPLNYWVAGTNYTAQGKSQLQNATFESPNQDVFDANTSFRAGYLAEYMMHRFEDLARMLKFNGPMTRDRSYMVQKVWADMFDALDWGGRMKVGKSVMEVYEELADYYSGGGSPSSYKNMYTKDNTYGELNNLVTGSAVPGIDLDISRAAHGDEYADPFYYYYDRRLPPRDPKNRDYICDADRMFLHSYWRDCFASRQQLFLIFVRAESTALGGNGEGTPAQQGGRAVALVWRDPEAPAGTYADEREVPVNQTWKSSDGRYYSDRQPHKMRVLFYRQLD